jgi:DNA polymerase-3 subunit gamma/tau
MSYTALARKWRPRSFAEMSGQEHVLRALSNALDSDRVHHAFLFTGTRGVGKTTIARILAKSLNCEQGVSSKPCGVCSACREIDDGRFIDLLEVDAASRTKVDDTRDLLDNVPYAPARGRYKVYLIDEVHMLSTHSFNALLKTLEEPPPHVKFLLATTDPQRLPVTVLSRCLQFNLKRLPTTLIAARIAHILGAENIAYEAPAVQLLAHAADGSMRDGLSLLDQLIAFGGGKVAESETRAMLGTVNRERVLELLRALARGDARQLLESVDALEQWAPDYGQVLDEIAALLTRVALRQAAPAYEGDELYPLEWITELAATLSSADVQLFYQTAILGRRDLTLAPDPGAGLRMTLLRMLAFQPAAAGALPKITGGAGVPNVPSNVAPMGAARADAVAPVTPPAAKAVAASAVDLVSPAGWVNAIGQLDLSGAARQLAAHCVPLGREAGVLRLVLAPVNRNLKTRQLEDKLTQAVSRLAGEALRIDIEVGEPPAPSAAELSARESAAQLAATQRALEDDPTVQGMQKMFGATLQPHSVRSKTSGDA